jgi:signal transduction histidine kinase
MSSKTGKRPIRSAAWRISLWATLAFAIGTTVVFVFLQSFVAGDIQRRTDAWLAGEVETLGDVAEHTPKDDLYDRVVGEVAELASREVPNKEASESEPDNAVFFLQTGSDGALKLWVGQGNGNAYLRSIQAIKLPADKPVDLHVPDSQTPFRVASVRIDDGSHIYLGLSERDELRVLWNLRRRFMVLWFVIVLLGFGAVYLATSRMLKHVRNITDAASQIGHSDLTARVPTNKRNDEVSRLAETLNGMLDRIENSMHQLHTITDSLAHDLRSPLTAIRGKLEMSLSSTSDSEHSEQLVGAIEELDRLADFLNKSLDVAEARADALRLSRTSIDLCELLRVMSDLYEPSMTERGLKVNLRCEGTVRIDGDAALIHRMVANLFDNELKHVPPGRTLNIDLRSGDGVAELALEDNGPGFDADVLAHVFERRVKRKGSDGHGLGLAFIDAVTRAHGGTVTASNREGGGARITVTLALEPEESAQQPASKPTAEATVMRS